jgi:hypothetical protein
MRSKDITKIVVDYFETDFTIKSRKRTLTYMRGLNNVLCKKYTKETLEAIGDNYYSSDHATVLHSINMFKDNYINQKSPINMLDSYHILDSLIKNNKDVKTGDNNNGDENYLKYKEAADKIQFLKSRVINLTTQLKNVNKIINERKLERINLEDKYTEIFKDLAKLNDKQLKEFHQNRLIPYNKIIS